MAVMKDKKTGTWYAQVRYDDWQGKSRRTKKRGFATKKEALEWERSFLHKRTDDLDMSFSQFVKTYEEDRRPRLRENTWLTKEHIIRDKLLPYFGKMAMNEIDAKTIMCWQNKMLQARSESGKPYSPTYLKIIHNQLTAILSHAFKYYGLKTNPTSKVESIGKKNATEMKFWTQQEYAAFSKVAMSEPRFFYPFEVLYWCGLRLGEMLALTYEDVDLKKKTIRVNKSLQRIHGESVVTDPKTAKGIRTISMPIKLAKEMEEYMALQRSFNLSDQMFQVSKSSMNNRLKRFAAEAGVKPIRVHDLRHSHVSLLIELGFSAVAIADRVGHESIEITLRYAHLFPTQQTEMANCLDLQMGEMRNAS